MSRRSFYASRWFENFLIRKNAFNGLGVSNCGVFGGCRVFVLVAVAAVVVGDSDIVRYDNADVETNENLSQQPEELGKIEKSQGKHFRSPSHE